MPRRSLKFRDVRFSDCALGLNLVVETSEARDPF